MFLDLPWRGLYVALSPAVPSADSPATVESGISPTPSARRPHFVSAHLLTTAVGTA